MTSHTPLHLTPQVLSDLATQLPAGHTTTINAVTTTSVNTLALNRQVVTTLDPTTEIKTDTLGPTDQKRSGRCWMFATLNLYRHHIARTLGVDHFEFSEAYLQFFDKWEKANHYLRLYAALASGSLTPATDPDNPDATPAELLDRALNHLTTHATINDGGQFNYVENLIAAYGLVPDYAMPETDSSSNTRAMDTILNAILRPAAYALRTRLAETPTADVEDIISRALRSVYSVLATHLGVPPTHFHWHYRTTDNTYVDGGMLTPHDFADRFLPASILAGYTILTHDPRPEISPNTHYAIQGQTNRWGTDDFHYVTTDLDTIKALAAQQLDAGTPVWFTADVNQQFRVDLHLWDADLLQLDQLYGVDTAQTKAQRMATATSRLTHAMVLTGLQRDDTGRPVKWRVENSWGKGTNELRTVTVGAGGYGTMSDSWLDNYVFQIAVPTQDLPAPLAAAAATEPTVLPIWDAMS